MSEEAQFRCPDCKTITYGPENEDKVTCRKCGAPYAIRSIGAPGFVLEGLSGDFPTALDKWEKRHSRFHSEDNEE